jgi:hypothetical protein
VVEKLGHDGQRLNNLVFGRLEGFIIFLKIKILYLDVVILFILKDFHSRILKMKQIINNFFDLLFQLQKINNLAIKCAFKRVFVLHLVVV